MTINAKTSVDTLKGLINANFPLLKGKKTKEAKDVLSTIAYAKEHADKAKRSDFVQMVKDIMNILGDKFIAEPVMAEQKPVEKVAEEKTTKKVIAKKSEKSAPVAENSVKKPVAKKSKAVKETEQDEDEEETEAVEKPAKKSTKKKVEGVKVLEGAENPKSLQLAKQFPETIEVDGDKYKIDHEVKTIEDLAEGEFEFAFYWTKRHLRQFPYFNGWLGQPKSFPNDLDTAQLIYVSDEGKVAHCVSDATEGTYTILPVDMEEMDGIRYSAGIEFQIYRKVEDDEE